MRALIVERLGDVTSDNIENSNDGSGDSKADDIRLRKRTFRGRDYVLKKTIAVLLRLRQKHAELQAAMELSNSGIVVQRSSSPARLRNDSLGAAAVSTPWSPTRLRRKRKTSVEQSNRDLIVELSATDQELVQRASDAANRSWHMRAFVNSGEARYLSRLNPVFDEHFIVDCNGLWSEQFTAPREELLGRPIREVFAPATWQRYQVGMRMIIKHRAMLVRNAPIYALGCTADIVSWVEYEDGTSEIDGRTLADSDSKVRVPKFAHSINMNLRPWRRDGRGTNKRGAAARLMPASAGGTASSSYRPAVQYAVLVSMTGSGAPGEEIGVFPWAEDGSDVSSVSAPLVSMTRSELIRTIPQAKDLISEVSQSASVEQDNASSSVSAGSSSIPTEDGDDMQVDSAAAFDIPSPASSSNSGSALRPADPEPVVRYYTV